MSELIVNATLPEIRIAQMTDGKIEELLIERSSDRGVVGNIYKGRVTRVLPGMQAAFVDIGLEKAAFLYVDDIFVDHQRLDSELDDGGFVASPDHDDDALELDVDGDSQDVSAGDAADSQTDSSADAAPSVDTLSDEGQKASSEELTGETTEMTGNEAAEVEEPNETDGNVEEVTVADSSDETVEEATAGETSDEGSEKSDEEAGEGTDEDAPSEEDYESTDMSSEDNESAPAGTVAEKSADSSSADSTVPKETKASSDSSSSAESSAAGGESSAGGGALAEAGGSGSEESKAASGTNDDERPKRGRRGRRGRGRRGGRTGEKREGGREGGREGNKDENADQVPVLAGEGSADLEADRYELSNDYDDSFRGESETGERPVSNAEEIQAPSELGREAASNDKSRRPNLKSTRGRDRRVRSKPTRAAQRPNVNIQDLLKEGQEVIVQIAKEPIATKGARLTCHVSLAGRNLVCMPTVDHVGVSRRIERDDERRRLKEFVFKHRPGKMGFIVRTASNTGGKDPEKWIGNDMDYLSSMWSEILAKADKVSAPALVFEDMNPVTRAIRDWVTEDVKKIVVDNRYYYSEARDFVSKFMPALKDTVELYQGDIPVFDAYGISTELHRALDRRVWLKSGGYIVIDQAEALVAIDVNTGRFVGKKNLEDTIIKTNLEAVREIAYQLRLRNLGGIIILDLIDMEKEENRNRVVRALEDELKIDRARPTIVGMSKLGLIEMTRKRTRDSLVRALCSTCDHCEGRGFIKSRETVAIEIMRELEREGIQKEVKKILVQAHPGVIDVLAIDFRGTLDQLERRYRKELFLQEVADFHLEQFEVTVDKASTKTSALSRTQSRDGRSSGGGDRKRSGGRGRDGRDSGKSSDGANKRSRGGRGRDRDDQRKRSKKADGPPPVARPNSETGNRPPPVAAPNTKSEPNGNAAPVESQVQGGSGMSDEDEEDRLAFLRAQAAQDAAIANVAPEAASPSARFQRGANNKGGGGRGRNSPRSKRPAGNGNSNRRRGRTRKPSSTPTSN